MSESRLVALARQAQNLQPERRTNTLSELRGRWSDYVNPYQTPPQQLSDLANPLRWPAMAVEGIQTAVETVPRMLQPGYDYSDTRQAAEDAFNVAGVVGAGSLLGTAAKPANAVGTFGGKLGGSAGDLDMSQAARMARARDMGFDTDQVWYHGTATDQPINEFVSGMKGDSPHLEHETPSIFFTDSPDLAGQYARSTADQRRQRISDELVQAGKYEEMQALYQSGDVPIMTQARQFTEKALEILPEDVAKYVRPYVESFRHGSIDIDAVFDAVGEEKARRFFELLEMSRNVGSEVAENAAIYNTYLPNGMREVDASAFGGNFNSIVYDQLLREAKASGAPGLVIRNVVDSPYGASDPATIAAVFDPSNIRSVNAAFDPAKSDSANLLASRGAPVPVEQRRRRDKDEIF